MADDKAQMLRSLAIDRAATGKPSPSARPIWGRAWAGAAVLMIAVVGAAVWLLVVRPPDQTQVVPPEAKAPPTQPVVSEPRRAGSLVASGYVVARRKATVAAEITGKIIETMVEEGMVIEAGQVIAKLDSILATKDLALARSRAQSAEAAVAAIEADLAEAERVFKRAHDLSQRNVTSQADLTKAEARVAVLRAQLRQSESQLATARLDAQRAADVLDKHDIRAPFTGIVIERSAQPGEVISPMSAGGFTRTGICTIVDMDSIEIEVDVNEAFIGRVRPRTKVGAVLDAYPDWTIPGAVIAIVPTANREKATVRVRIGLQQKDSRILPDMAVKVTFAGDDRPADARSNFPSAAAN